MNIVFKNNTYEIIGEYNSFKEASEYAKNEAKRINKIITIKREENSWRLLVSGAKKSTLDNNTFSRNADNKVTKSKPKLSVPIGYSQLVPYRSKDYHHQIKKNIPVIKDQYQGESFASTDKLDNLLREDCYICNGSGGANNGCLKCQGTGFILKENEDS